MAKFDLSAKQFDVAGAHIAIVSSRFNDAIVSKLLQGALRALGEHGIDDAHTTQVRVPGAFEIPLAASVLARDATIDAVITLGAVVRGDTPHFEYVAGECAAGINRVALDCDKPVIFGVLTLDNARQARERTGGSHGNKGYESALAALEMVSLLRQLR